MKLAVTLLCLAIPAMPALALVTDQGCFDQCAQQAGSRLQCLTRCSRDDAPLAKGAIRPRATPIPEHLPVIEADEMFVQLMAQADAACRAGNKQACVNYQQLKAGLGH